MHLLPDDHANKSSFLHNIGNSFLRRFERSGDLADIDKAISFHEQAEHLTPDDHASKSRCHTNLGVSLLRRFGCSQNPINYSTALSQFRCAANSSSASPSTLQH